MLELEIIVSGIVLALGVYLFVRISNKIDDLTADEVSKRIDEQASAYEAKFIKELKTEREKAMRQPIAAPKNKLKSAYKFKTGDNVQNKETGEIDTVEMVPGMKRYDDVGYKAPKRGFVLVNSSWELQKNWKPVEKKKRGRPRKK